MRVVAFFVVFLLFAGFGVWAVTAQQRLGELRDRMARLEAHAVATARDAGRQPCQHLDGDASGQVRRCDEAAVVLVRQPDGELRAYCHGHRPAAVAGWPSVA